MCSLVKVGRIAYSVAAVTVLMTHKNFCTRIWCSNLERHVYMAWFFVLDAFLVMVTVFWHSTQGIPTNRMYVYFVAIFSVLQCLVGIEVFITLLILRSLDIARYSYFSKKWEQLVFDITNTIFDWNQWWLQLFGKPKIWRTETSRGTYRISRLHDWVTFSLQKWSCNGIVWAHGHAI